MYYNIEAIILKRESWREDDLLVTAYSKDKGKLKLQARGAKKIRSKLAGHLEPVSLSLLNVTRGKNIDQLIGAQMVEPYGNIKTDLVKLGYANWFLEVIDELVEEGERDEKIFKLLYKALVFLDKNSDKNKYILARISFGFKLLELLGLSPVEKGGLKFKKEINYILKNNLDNIFINQEIKMNLKKLNEILDMELRWYLDDKLKSEKFLKEIIR